MAAAAPPFVHVAGFVFAPARPKRKYDKPIVAWTNDQKIIDELSKETTLRFKHGKPYVEHLVTVRDKLTKDEERLEQLQNRIRVFPPEMTVVDRELIHMYDISINKLKQQIENILHNSELDLIVKTEHRSGENILEVIEFRNPVYVEDDEKRIHPIYFHKQTKIMATGDHIYPRLGVTFSELGIRPLHFYGPEDPKYAMIQDTYNRTRPL